MERVKVGERESRRGKRDRRRRGGVKNKKSEVAIVEVVMMDIAELSRNVKTYIEGDYLKYTFINHNTKLILCLGR